MTLSLLLPPNGIVSVAPTAITPGRARRRLSASSANACSAGASLYRAAGRETEAVSTPLGSNPGSTASSSRKLAKRSPAPTSSTNANATCATTSARRSDRAPRPLVPVRPSSRSTAVRFTGNTPAAGISPRSTPIAAAIPIVKRTTMPSIAISSPRGSSCTLSLPISRSAANPTASPATADTSVSSTLSDIS